MAARFGTGAFVEGYEVKLAKDEDESKSEYSVVRSMGMKVDERTNIMFEKRPKKLIQIYEFESCPFCRKVREAVTLLDLDVVFYPCPKGGKKYRQVVEELGGKLQFPYMRDPNTNVNIYESDDIIQYLYDTYGPTGSAVPPTLKAGPLTTLSCSLALLPRAGKGSQYIEAKSATEPIVFWGYEASPFCKIVREKLVELEIPHIQRTCGRGSAKRQELLDKTGTFQVPYIEDPNTGISMFESLDIIKYLEDTYAVK
jgi:glutathione S-transferase